MKQAWFILLACAPIALFGKLTSAQWSVSPAAPLYVGQTYDLTLTVETDPNEELVEYRVSQGPKEPSAQPLVETVNGRRRTTFRWEQVEHVAKVCAIPEGELVVKAMVVQQHGFARFAQSNVQRITVPAFSYTVIDLPEDAKGAPIGQFELRLTADRKTFVPGDVRILRATLQAREGVLPENFTFELKDAADGRCYPFRTLQHTPKVWVAEAYYVTQRENDLTLQLKPLKAFDLATRSLTWETCPPLTIKAKVVEETAIEDQPITLGQGETHGLPLRYAPTDTAPVIGILAPPYTRHESFNAWTRISCAEGEGWIRTTHLGEQP